MVEQNERAPTVPIQVYPISILQFIEHPSLLPLSHFSNPPKIPSPQRIMHQEVAPKIPIQEYPGVIWQLIHSVLFLLSQGSDAV